MEGNGLAFKERKWNDIIILRFSIITSTTAADKPVSKVQKKVPMRVLNPSKKNPKFRDQTNLNFGFIN